MKGRQCGRENTPSRSTLSKEEKINLSKIGSKLNQININFTRKAWDEEDQLTSIVNSDRAENFEGSKGKKITQINVQLKQFNPKVKVVRVQSSRKQVNPKASKRISKRRNPTHHAFNLTTNKDELANSSSGKLTRSGKKMAKKDMPPLPLGRTKSTPPFNCPNLLVQFTKKLDDFVTKRLLKSAFSTWKEFNNPKLFMGLINNKINEEEKSFSSASPSKHKKKISEMIQKPFSLLLLNNSSIKYQVSAENKMSNIGTENIENLHECKEESTSPDRVATKDKDFQSLSKGSKISPERIEKSPKKIKFDKFNSINKLKPTISSTLKSHNKEVKKMKKHKTKEALKRYKEINHMLEKIQREAAKLGNDYANKVNSNESTNIHHS